MSRADVLARLAAHTRPLESLAAMAADGRREGIPSAVLVPLIDHPDGFTILLTERTAHLASHRGQVCFPGGRMEAADASPVATALREADEEVGLDPASVRLLGALDDYATITGYLVTPVVGVVAPPLRLRASEQEVARIFEVPLAFILDPANHRRMTPAHSAKIRTTYALPFQGHYIWGATAAMLLNLYRILSRGGPRAEP